MVFLDIYTGQWLAKPIQMTAACVDEAMVIAQRYFEDPEWFKQAQIRDKDGRLLVDMTADGMVSDLRG